MVLPECVLLILLGQALLLDHRELQARVEAVLREKGEIDTPTYKAIVGTSRRTLVPLMEPLGIDAYINPRATTVSSILRHIRHGRVRGVYSIGDAEAELSEAGLAASLGLARELAAWRPQRVVTSPLRRAWVLAEALAGHCGLDLHVDPAFVELDRGAWTHRHHRDVEAESPGAIARYKADPEGGNGPGGERESEICARVWGAVDALVAATPGQRVVVVTHGHVIRVVMRRLLGWGASESLDRFMPYHARVETRLTPDGRGEVLRHPEPRAPEALRRHD